MTERPAELCGFATLDHEREARQGVAEVVYAEGKTVPQLLAICARLREVHGGFLATRVSEAQAAALAAAHPELRWNATGRVAACATKPPAPVTGPVAVVTAGTSDLPVSEEACATLEALGHEVVRVTDVGVAGLHRVLGRAEALERAAVLIVVAGMEGALPSVVGGLVRRPVIAVPTSVGYGASFGGIAALLGMLNSCAAGVTVVNIDNGFGAALAAHRILAR